MRLLHPYIGFIPAFTIKNDAVIHNVDFNSAGILQQFAISEATLLAWSSMDGESPRSGSNQGSVAHLSEVNQESITSRGKGN